MTTARLSQAGMTNLRESAPAPKAAYVPLPTRRGLSREEAAGYIGVSPSKFDQLVKDGRMPKPKRVDARTIWDVRHIDKAFDKLPSDDDDDETNPWD